MLFDKDKIQKINLFENLTHSKVKGLVDEEKLIIIVEPGEMGKALGKNGSNIKMFEKMMHKQIKIIEFSNDPIEFVNKFIYPVKAESIMADENTIQIKAQDRKTKGLLIGRERKNLNELSNLVKDYFNLNIKII